MNPVRIISPQFEPLGEVGNYESFQLIRRFYRPGEFELHINLGKRHTDQLQNGNIIMLGADTHKAGIIQYREIYLDDTAKETVVIRGPTLKGVLSRRLTVPDATGYDRIIGPAETVMKHYVSNHSINPADPDRIIPNLVNAPDQGRGVETPWQTRYENLGDVLEQIAEWCDIGWEVYLDITGQQWFFDIMEGRNLTAGQEILPPVIFSTEFGNIKGQKYVRDYTNEKNVGYAGGKGEEEQRLVLQVGNATGLARREVFLDCSNAEDATELTNTGVQELEKHKGNEALESEIIYNNSFVYGTDYDLGDEVTVMNKKWDVLLDTRLTEVKEIYEPEGFKLEGTFGNQVSTLGRRLKLALQRPIK